MIRVIIKRDFARRIPLGSLTRKLLSEKTGEDYRHIKHHIDRYKRGDSVSFRTLGMAVDFCMGAEGAAEIEGNYVRS